MDAQEIADSLESMASLVEASPNYRVLRRLNYTLMSPFVQREEGERSRVGVFLDVETTGLKSDDEVIELAMVSFDYSTDGRIFGVRETFQGLQEPSKPIPLEITALTGITAEQVAGQRINPAEVGLFIADAAVILAHNAAFDRPHAERLYDGFALKPWACSASQMDWASEGFESPRLGFLAYEHGFFYDKHRATEDCLAALAIIGAARKTCTSALGQILERARRPTWRVWAEGAPFEQKDTLKARGYRWNGDNADLPRAWYGDVEDIQGEIDWLRKEIYGRTVSLQAQKITALERFSARPLPFDAVSEKN